MYHRAPYTATTPAHVLEAIAALRPLGETAVIPHRRAPPPLAPHEAAAVATIYRAYAGMLLTIARRMLGSNAEAEDALHDVFCRLPWVVAQYRGGGFGGWLKQTLIRASLMRLRAARRRREVVLADDADAARDDVRLVESAEYDADVRRALDALPESLRRVLELRVLHDYSHAEIAAALDITASASEVRLCRALKRLRAALDERVAHRRAS